LVYHRVVTDGQTDRRTDRNPIANTRSQQYLPVQLSRVKSEVAQCVLKSSWDAVLTANTAQSAYVYDPASG